LLRIMNKIDPQEVMLAAAQTVASDIESLLERLLGPNPEQGESSRPQRLIEAMRYGSLAGGKRLRPFLVVESGRLFDVPRSRALMAGAALECVHCYSLVHDDLPAMDDDALRRGKPTVHKAYDDATAILVGDSLLTFAFDVMARADVHPEAAVRIELVARLARASGLGGMAGGQMLDLAAEGRFDRDKPRLGESDISTLQWMKTGALIHFACVAGGVLGKASPEQIDALSRYGAALGRAFQIADDLLDVEGDAAAVGKAIGKDAAAGKATLVGLLGITGARERLKDLVAEADRALAPFRADAAMLKATARFVAERRT
jgi:farnesyl diphosphate synthase